ncbi:DUF4232 domain-containing protein [Streptomyces sp. NPDC052701]|uniref:DUF4232 domain-containing protein n=1 Tax=Streptomyces sp. NPDC052701 TaxID=3155533 RepID=UPI00343BD95B
MRPLPTAVTAVTAALAAALLLTACDNGGEGSGDGGEKRSKEKAGGSACAVDTMGMEVAAGAAPAAGDTGNVTVTLTNRGTRCTLEGFPGVDLVAGTASATVPAEEGAQERRLTLAENATASFTITYVRGEAGGEKSLAARKAVLTLPGATASQSFTWSYGDVALKGGAGEPDASVSAFQTAGD